MSNLSKYTVDHITRYYHANCGLVVMELCCHRINMNTKERHIIKTILKERVNLEHFAWCDLAYFCPRHSISSIIKGDCPNGKKICLQPDLHEIWHEGCSWDPNNRKNTNVWLPWQLLLRAPKNLLTAKIYHLWRCYFSWKVKGQVEKGLCGTRYHGNQYVAMVTKIYSFLN